MESSGNFTRESMEGVKDQWVWGRERAEFSGERGVNQVDEECLREESDCFVVRVRGGDVIWLMRQGIRGAEILARNMLKD